MTTGQPAGPPEPTRRQFLLDVLDVLGDADVIVLDDGTEVDRAALLTQLARELDR